MTSVSSSLPPPALGSKPPLPSGAFPGSISKPPIAEHPASPYVIAGGSPPKQIQLVTAHQPQLMEDSRGSNVAEDSPERMRIRQLYQEKTKERRVQLYNEALNEAIRREMAEASRAVTFTVKVDTRFGQNVHIVGSSSHLGNWSTTASVPMEWSPGNVWTATVNFGNSAPEAEGGCLEYKYIVNQSDGGHVDWEFGANHILDKTEPAPLGNRPGHVIQADVWGCGGRNSGRY
eukprot:GHVS01064625.1.p1 GENE.GHVS01064625.1~~GHVS01064625.1.p1  ORF type:complete len:232 (-),score=23.34 GHVS01064625.1:736-1431(-)